MPTLTVGILARDNEQEIVACLESASWADETLVILDTRSTDRTALLAESLGARVVQSEFRDFAQQRNFGLSQATTDWLFYVDTDERATPALGEEIRRVIATEDRAGWWVPRRNLIWGHEVRHGGWFPDYQLRLLRVGRAQYDPTRQVHEVVILEGPEGHLQCPLLHYNYRTMGQFAAKQGQYVDLEAGIRYKQGTRPKPWTYVLQPLREFWRRYVRLGGWRDGFTGLVLSTLIAYYYGYRVTVALGRLWRQQGGNKTPGSQ